MIRLMGTMSVVLFALVCLAMAQTDTTETALIAQGDSAYAAYNNKAAAEYYTKATQVEPNNYEATWKLSRAYADMGEALTRKDERNRFFKKSEELARKAIQIDSTGEKGHLYLAIALGRVALDAGAKERVQMSKEIKAETEKAIQLDPNDYLAWHVLGRWNKKMATLSWIEKSFANIFLGGVPKGATLENAMKDFKKAIELNPHYINNYYQLGLTYEDMGDKKMAIEEYKKVGELPQTNWEDPKIKKEAQERLKHLS
ncbi:MAG: tetratricopeptide repeat protein [Calditrichia bacterium]